MLLFLCTLSSVYQFVVKFIVKIDYGVSYVRLRIVRHLRMFMVLWIIL